MEIPNYITSLTRQDLMDIARAANMTGEGGIVVEPRGDKYVISVDQNWIANLFKKLQSGNP